MDEAFATRLWGEPLVLYRASGNEVVCVRDACPHRSAPLSMGEVQAPSTQTSPHPTPPHPAPTTDTSVDALANRSTASRGSSSTPAPCRVIVLPRLQLTVRLRLCCVCRASARADLETRPRPSTHAVSAQDGVLRCFYHGWGFGSEGKCVAVPTMGTGKLSACATNHAIVERDGVLWIWRGHPLTADASKLPRRAAASCLGRSGGVCATDLRRVFVDFRRPSRV